MTKFAIEITLIRFRYLFIQMKQLIGSVFIVKGVFQQNLTSDLVFEALTSLGLGEHSKLLDLGCGDGNIGIRVAQHLGLSRVYGSDVSSLSIEKAIENARREDLDCDYRVGSMLGPWENEKFDVISCDVAAISSLIAERSDWYEGVSCLTGEDGLALVQPIIKKIHNHLEPHGLLVIPQISLANKKRLRICLDNKFTLVKEVVRREWPVPSNLIKGILEVGNGLINENWEIQKKFGLYIACTSVLVCSGVKTSDRE